MLFDLSAKSDNENGGGWLMKMSLAKETVNIIITGVGGQGNVMASRVLAGMLVGSGYLLQ
jgi:hypothetical protein